MTRILGLGDNTIDTYVDAALQYPGGNAVNVAVMAHRLGADTAYLGCVGDDDGGRLLRAALEAEGVDISRMRTRAGANARAFIRHEGGDRHFLKSERGVRADYRWTEADDRYIATFDHVHTSIYSELGAALPRIASSARSLSLDCSNRWTHDYLAETVAQARIVFLSGADLSAREIDDVLDLCLGLGAEAVVVTRGSAGALGATAGSRVEQQAEPTEIVDTLGAGDGFIAGFLVAHLDGAALAEAIAAGAAYAANVCSWHGGFGHGARWSGSFEGIGSGTILSQHSNEEQA